MIKAQKGWLEHYAEALGVSVEYLIELMGEL